MTFSDAKHGMGGMVAETAISDVISAAPLAPSLILGGLLLLIGP